MKGSSSSSDAIWSRLLRGENNDEQVEQLLAQFNDENALQLNLNSHRSVQPFKSVQFSSEDVGRLDCLGIDQELALRYSKLKAPPPIGTHLRPTGKSDKTLNSDKKAVNRSEKDSDLNELDKGGDESKERRDKCRAFADEEEEKILGQELAARFAALKTPSPVSKIEENDSLVFTSPTEDRGFDSHETSSGTKKDKNSDSQGRSFGTQKETNSEVEQVQRLLASVQDSIRLEKAKVSGVSSSSSSQPYKEVEEEKEEEEDYISDTEVDKLVEWAKDAARLEVLDSEDEDDNDEGEGEDYDKQNRRGENIKK